MPTAFRDRTEAGRLLAEKLGRLRRPPRRAGAGPAARRRPGGLRGGAGAGGPARRLRRPQARRARATRSWPWAPSPRAASASSTTTWCRRCASPAEVIEAGRRAGAARARAARAGLSRRPPGARRARPHGDPGRRRPGDRLDDARRRRRPAPARAGPHRRGRPDRGARRPARSSATRRTSASATSPPSRSTPSASGTRTSPRRPTTRSATCSSGPRPRSRPRRGPMRSRCDDDHGEDRPGPTTWRSGPCAGPRIPSSAQADDYDPLLDLIGDARFVLLRAYPSRPAASIGDPGTDEVEHAEVVLHLLLPADQDPAEPVHPAVCPLHHPAPGLVPRLLASAPWPPRPGPGRGR